MCCTFQDFVCRLNYIVTLRAKKGWTEIHSTTLAFAVFCFDDTSLDVPRVATINYICLGGYSSSSSFGERKLKMISFLLPWPSRGPRQGRTIEGSPPRSMNLWKFTSPQSLRVNHEVEIAANGIKLTSYKFMGLLGSWVRTTVRSVIGAEHLHMAPSTSFQMTFIEFNYNIHIFTRAKDTQDVVSCPNCCCFSGVSCNLCTDRGSQPRQKGVSIENVSSFFLRQNFSRSIPARRIEEERN